MKRSILTAVAIIALPLVAGPASGQAPDRQEIARAQARHDDEQARARRLRNDARAIELEIERLRVQLLRMGRDEVSDVEEVVEQRERLADLNSRETELAVRLGRERGRQTRLLAALQNFSRDPPPPLLVTPQRANDAVRAQILIQSITPILEGRAQRLVAERSELERLRREAILAAGDLLNAESSLADRRADIERTISEKQALETLLLADADTAEAEARAAAARVRDLGGLLRELTSAEREAALASQLPGGRNRLLRPVQGPLVSEFGGGTLGVTFASEARGLVRSPADGVVEYAGPLQGWNEVVVIRLGPGWRMILAGLARADSVIGTRVAEGEPLGRLPETESPELYFELRVNDRPVDPAPWLAAGAGA